MDADVEHVWLRACRWQGVSLRAVIAAASASMTAAAAWPSASARRRARSPVRVIPATSPASFAATANGSAAAARPVIAARSGDNGVPAYSQLGVARGRESAPACGAVIPRPAQPDRAEHRVDGLNPVGHEPCLVPRAAGHPRAAVAAVGGQQRLQHRPAQF
ncbi:MAG: hypothetical protein ACRDOK_25075, partial [Streptosporangiaceae bacterium]